MRILDTRVIDSEYGNKRHTYPLIMTKDYTEINNQWGYGYLMMTYPSLFRLDYEDEWFRLFYFYSLQVHEGVQYEN
jgi:hypothetical protein